MTDISALEKYNSIHFAVPKGAKIDDYNDGDKYSISLSLDLCSIKDNTKGAAGFYKVVILYFQDRAGMIIESGGIKRDPTLEAHRMTLLTISGECVQQSCQLLNIDFKDTNIQIDVHYMPDKNIAGSISLGIAKTIPKHKAKAMNTIFNEFQSKLGGYESDISNVQIDNVDAKA